jgi:hypothetical protein
MANEPIPNNPVRFVAARRDPSRALAPIRVYHPLASL